jgi:hypothetical protein
LELNLNLSLILKNINDKIINDSFYMFDPIIEFNEYGREIIPEHHELFYGEKTIVRDFRKITDIKPNNINFSKYNFEFIERIIYSFKEYL